MSFRNNLRETLDFCGMTQKELAYKAKITQRSLENYLKEDASIPSVDKAVKIAQVLGVTVEYLVTGKDTKNISASVEPEIKQLIRSIHNLPVDKQRVVIKNAISLSEMLKDK
jgi:transcriptional regulator with XRE-family HTH domain